jgi:hypothetical protein
VQLGEGSEGGLEFALGAGLHDTELHPSRPRSFSPDSDEEPDTVGDGSEDDRDCRGCVARRLCRGDAARSYDQVDLMGRRDRLPTQAVDRNGPRPSCIQPPRLVPRHTRFAESQAKCGHIGCRLTRRSPASPFAARVIVEAQI